MSANPFLKKLGLADTDRVVIFHADDIGMCQASVAAYSDLLDFGLMSSAATMVPCSWFPATAAFCRAHPQVDMGVHLTLTSEWDGYRWRPLIADEAAQDLLDEEGYLPRLWVSEKVGEAAVYRELKAQIDHALAQGIDATHIDNHMLAVFPRYIRPYLQLSQEYQLPAFILRLTLDEVMNFGASQAEAEQWVRLVDEHEAAGMPLLDHWCVMSYEEHQHRFEQAKALLEKVPAGITYFLFHPATDTPEIQTIAPDWRTRVADYELFQDEKFRQYVQQLGIHIVGWRELKALI